MQAVSLKPTGPHTSHLYFLHIHFIVQGKDRYLSASGAMATRRDVSMVAACILKSGQPTMTATTTTTARHRGSSCMLHRGREEWAHTDV